MQVLHLDKNHPILIQMLETAGLKNILAYTTPKSEILKVLPEVDALTIRSRFPINHAFLKNTKKLKCIGRVGAGLENIDIEAAAALGIKVFNAPEGNAIAVGEHALGLLLSLLNKIHTAHFEVQQGLWQREQNRGTELHGKTVGIIGYGIMGKAFARRLQGFNCDVICYDIVANKGDAFATQVSLEALQKKAEIVSIHTPHTPLTNGFFNAAFISKFKKPFWLINTARGSAVVIKDLIQGLENKMVLGAGLDVIQYENASFESLSKSVLPPELNTLLRFKNVVLTPHVAGWTHQSHEKLATAIAKKLINCLNPTP